MFFLYENITNLVSNTVTYLAVLLPGYTSLSCNTNAVLKVEKHTPAPIPLWCFEGLLQ